MSETKHTPGPWSAALPLSSSRRVFTPTDTVEIRSGRDLIACLYLTNFPQEGMDAANAALIAAAPDLLKMLKTARECIAYCRARHPDPQKGEGIPIEMFIDEVIAKAEAQS